MNKFWTLLRTKRIAPLAQCHSTTFAEAQDTFKVLFNNGPPPAATLKCIKVYEIWENSLALIFNVLSNIIQSRGISHEYFHVELILCASRERSRNEIAQKIRYPVQNTEIWMMEKCDIFFEDYGRTVYKGSFGKKLKNK